MADRSIVTRIRAEAAQFLSTMGKVEKAAKDVGTAAERSGKQADSAFSRFAGSIKKNQADLDRLGTTSLIAGGTIAAGLGLGVKAFADFDEAMSSVNAALPEAGSRMKDLRDLAVEMGGDTAFSATEAAQGITELAKAGVDAEAILGGGLKGALDLAAAGQLEVGEAAEIAASAMVQFGLDGAQVPHIADLLAAAAGKAQGSVRDMGQALNQAGLVAESTGLTIEETTAGLAAFASAGLVGSDAGTSFKAMLQRLTPQSKEAETRMQELGISAFNAQGNFIGLEGLAGNLQESLAGLTDEQRNAALATIFGSDAVRAANILYKQGAEGIAQWTDEVNSAGFAAQQAAALTDNLKGDLERLGGAIESTFIANGEAANSALRSVVQTAEGAVEAFGSLPAPLQQGTLGLAALTAGGLLAFGALAKVVTTGVELSESLGKIREASPRAAKGMDLASRAAQRLAVAMAAVAVADALVNLDEMAIGVDTLTESMLNAESAVEGIDAAFLDASKVEGVDLAVRDLKDALDATFDPSAANKAENFIGAIRSLWADENLSKMGVASKRFEELDASLTGLVQSGNADMARRMFDEIATAAAEQGVSIEELEQKFPGYTEALAAVANEQTLGADTARDMASGVEQVEQSADDAQAAIDDLADAIRGFGQETVDARQAESDFQEAVDRASAAVKENGATLDLSTEKGRANNDELNNLRSTTLDLAADTYSLTGSIDQAAQKVEIGRQAFIDAATQMGLTAEEANALADEYGLIPADVVTYVEARGTEAAKSAINGVITTLNRLTNKTITVRTVYQSVGTPGALSTSTRGGLTRADGGIDEFRNGRHVQAMADGGMFDTSLGAMRPGVYPVTRRGILMAEEGAGPWEAFISGHPAKKHRSRAIADETVSRLGGEIVWRKFADGGMLGGSIDYDRLAGAVTRSEDHSARFYGDIYATDMRSTISQGRAMKRYDRTRQGP